MRRRSFLSKAGATVTSLIGLGVTSDPVSSMSEKPRIIGHRGAGGLAPDNTIQGIRKAYENNADGAEIDVRKTKDDKLVLFHNPVMRLDTVRANKIENLEYPEINRRYAGDKRIPTLDEALDCFESIDERFELMVELKADVGREVVSKLENRNMTARSTIISFEESMLSGIESVNRGHLTTVTLPERSIEKADEYDFSMLSAYMTPRLQDEFVEESRKRNVEVALWSLYDTRTRIEWAFESGADTLIVNRPDIANNVMNEYF